VKVLAFDIGEKRIGVASGDTSARIAFPVGVFETADLLSNSTVLQRLTEDHEPELLVVGLPISLNAQENQQVKRVKEVAESIAEQLGLPLVYQDERLTSVEAKRYFREAGYTEKEMRGKIDMIAASLILQAHLDTYQNDHPGDAQSGQLRQ